MVQAKRPAWFDIDITRVGGLSRSFGGKEGFEL
jgi:hypothetical protein